MFLTLCRSYKESIFLNLRDVPLSRQCSTAEADFMSCASRVERKVIMAIYSEISIDRYLTKMIISTFSLLLIFCLQHGMVTTFVSSCKVVDLTTRTTLNANELSPSTFCSAARKAELSKYLAPSK